MQGIMQLLTPYLTPVVEELFDLVGSGKAWTMGHVPATIKEVVDAVQDVVCLVPPPIILLCFHLDSVRPEGIKPVGGSSLVHLLVSSLYSLISR